MNSSFDYIITGAGASGLSLLVHLIQSGKFSDKKILLLERSPKTNNDRTWCFWETSPGPFESIVYKRWDKLWFHGENNYSKLNDISPYQYKLIKGIDYYTYCFKLIETSSNIEVRYGNIESITSNESGTYVLFNGEKIYAAYIFNSILFDKPVLNKNEHYLLQHFKGWVIKTATPVFNPEEATLMDFRVSQQRGTTFVYIMPFSETEALVEYTLFSEEILAAEEYDTALKEYVTGYITKGEYNISSEEFGVIPMTSHRFPQSVNNIINIGTAGGNTKASSGYTFTFIHKQSRAITEALIHTGKPMVKKPLSAGRFAFYDAVLLRILCEKSLPGSTIFTALFTHSHTSRILRFLDNETTVNQELRLIGCLPKSTFLSSAFAQIKM